MKRSTGVVRKVDELGRIVVPKEIRRTMSIANGDALEIFVDADGEIILKEYQPSCVVCGGMEDLLRHHNGTMVCSGCLDYLSTVKPC